MATIVGITMNYFMKSSLGPVDIKVAVLWGSSNGHSPYSYNHWRSSHYAIMHVRHKNSNIQGRSPNVVYHKEGAQWLSGRVLDSRLRGRGFEPHQRHCVVVLKQDTFILA